MGCKVEKKIILKYYGKKIFLIKDCKTKSIGMFNKIVNKFITIAAFGMEIYMKANITLIPGDGIGPEIIREAKKVLEAVADAYDHEFIFTEIDMGGCSIDKYGVPLTDEAIEIAKKSDAVLLGAVVRELTGGLYFGERYTKEIDGVKTAVDTLVYNENEIRRVAKVAFDIAMTREKKKVTSVDKANVLDSSRLWRSVVEEVAKEYPEVTLEHMLVDNAAMQLVKEPRQFDVMLTENMFGDILSDEASMIAGSIGMLPSASLGEGSFGLYEPSHGSAPDIAGKNKANPLATILSAAMLLRHSLGLLEEAQKIEDTIDDVLDSNYRTWDLKSPGIKVLKTSQMGDIVSEWLKETTAIEKGKIDIDDIF